jgi:serine/threonine protein phosphatase PrpC
MPPAVRVELAGHSSTGPVRERNEDRLAWAALGDRASVWATRGDERLPPRELLGPAVIGAVADGLGGHAGGDLASRCAVTTLLDRLAPAAAASRHLPSLLRETFDEVNARLLAGELSGNGRTAGRSQLGAQTTLTCLVLTPDAAHFAHVGDSRLYRLRDQTLELLTTDHTQAMELLRMKIIRPEQAASHPGRHLLTRSLGGDVVVRVDVRSGPVWPGDAYLLCSDGAWSGLSPGEIIKALEGNLASGVEDLMERSLARGGDDNASVIALRVIGVEDAPEPVEQSARRPLWRRIVGA